MLHHVPGLAMTYRTIFLDTAQVATLFAAAEMDANGWTIVIAAVFLGISQVVQLILGYLRERDKMNRETMRDAKVEQVAVRLEERESKRDEKLSEVADKVKSLDEKQDKHLEVVAEKVEQVKTEVAAQVDKAIAISPSDIHKSSSESQLH